MAYGLKFNTNGSLTKYTGDSIVIPSCAIGDVKSQGTLYPAGNINTSTTITLLGQPELCIMHMQTDAIGSFATAPANSSLCYTFFGSTKLGNNIPTVSYDDIINDYFTSASATIKNKLKNTLKKLFNNADVIYVYTYYYYSNHNLSRAIISAPIKDAITWSPGYSAPYMLQTDAATSNFNWVQEFINNGGNFITTIDKNLLYQFYLNEYYVNNLNYMDMNVAYNDAINEYGKNSLKAAITTTDKVWFGLSIAGRVFPTLEAVPKYSLTFDYSGNLALGDNSYRQGTIPLMEIVRATIKEEVANIEYRIQILKEYGVMKWATNVSGSLEPLKFGKSYTDDRKIVYSYDTLDIPEGMYLGTTTRYVANMFAIPNKLYDSLIDSSLIEILTTNEDYSKSLGIYQLVKDTELYKENQNLMASGKLDTIVGDYTYCLDFASIKEDYSIKFNLVDGYSVPEQVVTRTTNGHTSVITSGTNDAFDSDGIQFKVNLPAKFIEPDDSNVLTKTKNNITETLVLSIVGDTHEPYDPDETDPPTDPDLNPSKPDLNPDKTPKKPSSDTVPKKITDISTTSNLYRIYQCTENSINAVAQVLWSQTYLDNVLKIQTNPIDNIISLKLSVFNIPLTSQENIMLGNVDTNVIGYRVNSMLRTTIGSFILPQMYNSFLDMTPYTNYAIYLPFVGWEELNPNDYIGMSVQLDLVLDPISLLGKYQLLYSGTNNLIAEWEFNAGIDVPISSTNAKETALNKYRELLSTGVNASIGMATGNYMQMADAALNTVNSMYTMASVNTKGSPTSNTSLITNRAVYIRISYPSHQDMSSWKHTKGQALMQQKHIGEMNGFIKCLPGVDLSGIPCTNEERDMIRNYLENGFYKN